MKKVFGLGVSVFAPSLIWACACGCGVFDVGTRSLFPTQPGGQAFVEYDFMDQDRNWSGTSKAPAADNADKKTQTDFFTAGAQYMFDRDWGALLEIPYWNRTFRTTDAAGDIVTHTHDALGDIRIKGIYTGFSDDMSSGITYGLKLPTGDHTYNHFDPDTEIGTGSTDVLLGGFLLGKLPVGRSWDWFLTGQWDQPALTQDDYRPGSEVDAEAGICYHGLRLDDVTVAPLAQVIGSHHWRDHGPAADPINSGYDRLLLSPGVECDLGSVTFYAAVGIPAYQRVNGDQLTARELFTVKMSYAF